MHLLLCWLLDSWYSIRVYLLTNYVHIILLWSSIIIIIHCAFCHWILNSLNSCIFLGPECFNISAIVANTCIPTQCDGAPLSVPFVNICYSYSIPNCCRWPLWYKAMKVNKNDWWWYLFVIYLHVAWLCEWVLLA